MMNEYAFNASNDADTGMWRTYARDEMLFTIRIAPCHGSTGQTASAVVAGNNPVPESGTLEHLQALHLSRIYGLHAQDAADGIKILCWASWQLGRIDVVSSPPPPPQLHLHHHWHQYLRLLLHRCTHR